MNITNEILIGGGAALLAGLALLTAAMGLTADVAITATEQRVTIEKEALATLTAQAATAHLQPANGKGITHNPWTLSGPVMTSGVVELPPPPPLPLPLPPFIPIAEGQ